PDTPRRPGSTPPEAPNATKQSGTKTQAPDNSTSRQVHRESATRRSRINNRISRPRHLYGSDLGVDMAWRDITLIFGHWPDRSVGITPRGTQAVTPGKAVGRGLEIPAGSPGRGRTGGTFGTMSEQFVSQFTVLSRFTRSGLANGRRRAGLPTMI